MAGLPAVGFGRSRADDGKEIAAVFDLRSQRGRFGEVGICRGRRPV